MEVSSSLFEARENDDDDSVQTSSKCPDSSTGHGSRIRSVVRGSKPIAQVSDTANTDLQMTDNEASKSLPSLPTVESEVSLSDLSIYNFDAYPAVISTTKRGRGRPRKDGSTIPNVQHRKILRGRGRPKRDESCTSNTSQPKIFPGRPRVRAKKIRQLFIPPSSPSHNIRSHSSRDLDTLSTTSDPLSSADPLIECTKKPIDAILPFGDPVDESKRCSLCNLPDSSSLGQGKLKAFHPTPGFSPEKCTDEVSTSGEKLTSNEEPKQEQFKISFKKKKSFKSGQERVRLRQKSQSFSECGVFQNPYSELEVVGFTSPPEIKQVFLTTGETYVHHNCAVYSEGVFECTKDDKGEDFVNVEKAVLNGMFQKCVRCENYGASVRCNTFDCDRIYHFPCAIASGVLQIAKTLKILCPSHLDMTLNNDIKCKACISFGNSADLLMCTLCFNYYHGKCLEPPIVVTPVVKIGWECLDCKTCQTCRQSCDENKMLVCEYCDKTYHTFCLKPMMSSVPKSGWKCQNCRVCGDCGARTPGSGPSSRWHLNYTVCDSCYQQRNKGVACPLCGKAYRQFVQRKQMRHCCVCQKYVHRECDQRSHEYINPVEYVCPICVNPVEIDESTASYNSELVASTKGKVLEASRSPELLLSSSRESFSSDNDNSFSSGESDNNFELASGKLVAKRRAKTAEFRRRKKNPKSKIKSFSMPGALCCAYPLLQSAFSEPKEYKTEDDDPCGADNKMVLVSSTDEFVLCQDLCVMCGSFGKGDDARLIACAQCGQCYHSYCAGIKVTPVVLNKGWRCLDCTVCEECGQPHDESRLLLCDECDLSFHIYCLDPPLKEVPSGNWKCKWCVVCIKCGARTPGLSCNWQVNYTHCGPCASYSVCSVCSSSYEDNDLIILCCQCERWSHGKCDQINTEDQAEKCSDYGYVCVLCRPPDQQPPHMLPEALSPSPEPEPIPEKPPTPPPKIKEHDISVRLKPPVQFYVDGVCLSENGLQHIKALTPELPKKITRPRKPRHSSFMMNLLPGSQAAKSLAANVESNEESNLEVKSEPEMKIEVDDEIRSSIMDTQKDLMGDGEKGEKKKRPRKIQKLGIGGFVVKPKRSSSCREGVDPVDISMETSEGSGIPLMGLESSELLNQEKPKRRRKPKKKTPLDESFPSYLRDAFFGKDLLSLCKKAGPNTDFLQPEDRITDPFSTTKAAKDPMSASSISQSALPLSSAVDSGMKDGCSNLSAESFADGQPTGTQDAKTSSSAVSSNEEHFLNIGNQGPENLRLNETEIRKITPTLKIKEEIIYESFSSKDSTCPDGHKDDIEGAFRPSASQVNQMRSKDSFGSHAAAFLSDASNSPVNISQSQTSSPFAVRTTNPIHTQSSPVHRDNVPSLHHQDSNSSWSESESSDQAQMPKSTMKWEADETLGLLSTISPVLYANINCPHLKLEYPNWNDRVKQIAKIWRSLPSEKRQPYLQKARENRAASRTQKSCDVDRCPKETKTQEIDQEKQWKQFQALRQLQNQKQQKILQEQRAQDTGLKLDAPQVSRPGLLNEIDPTIGDLTYEKMYSKKWPPESGLSKSDIVAPGPHSSQQQLPQGKADPTVQTSQGKSSEFMQVSQVHSSHDLSNIAVGELIGPSSSMSPTDHYSPQSMLSPRGLPSQHNFRLPYSPTSPIAQKSLLLSRGELRETRVIVPNLQKEMVYSPQPTPRTQGDDSFFQTTRVPFVPSVESKTSLVAQFSPDLVLGATGSPDVTSPKSFFVQSPAPPRLNRPATQSQVPVSLSNVIENREKVPNMLPSEHFLQQPLPMPSVGSNIGKASIPYKEDIFGSVSGFPPRPVAGPTSDCILPQQSFEHAMKENPDHSKLISHHQLRELLQKQHSKTDDLILEMRTKEATAINQWQKGAYGATTVQFVSKDLDCFRQPFPPASRSRNLSAKDSKPDLPSEMLSSSNLKLNLLPSDDSIKDDKNAVSRTASPLMCGTINSTSRQAETQQVLTSPTVKDHDNGKAMASHEGKCETNSAIIDDVMKKEIHDIAQLKHSDEGSSQSELGDGIGSPGLTKKRKTTAGDIVKDLESQPEGHDIANACNLDVLPEDVGELNLDDDELLGLGNDFNILEYADPELDKSLVGEGEKRNILDEHLDLDDKDELVEDEEDTKEHATSENKALFSGDIHCTDKSLLSTEKEPSGGKSAEKREVSELHDNLLEFQTKKEEGDKTDYKNVLHITPKTPLTESTDHIKKETKVFSSCNLPQVPFFSAEDLNLKTEVPSAKEIPPQSTISFPSTIQALPQENPPFSPQIAPPYRVGTVMKQNLPTGSQFQSPTLIPQQRNVFSHVGLPARPNVALLQQPNLIVGNQAHQTRSLLLQEQPLLLEDLVEQEKREQLRQTGDALLSDLDFERLKDDVFSGPVDDSLGGPGSLLGSHDTLKSPISAGPPLTSTVSHKAFGPPPYSLVWQNQESTPPYSSSPQRSHNVIPNVQTRPPIPNVVSVPSGIMLHGDPSLRAVPTPKPSPIAATPPSSPVADPQTEQDKQKMLQYEKFQAVLASQQKYFETEVFKLRKIKKALNAKQRQLRKNGSELAETDAAELTRISQELGALQKQFDQIRKQSKQHAIALQDYRAKQQKRQQQVPQSPIHTPMSSLQLSPQSSHSPHQMVSGASQSPMLSSSSPPLGLSPSHIQHSPSSSLLQQQQSSSAVSPSTLVQQTSPLVHQHMLPQQVHYQIPQSEGKTWCSPIHMTQISDATIQQQGERFTPKEPLNKPLKEISQSVNVSTEAADVKPDLIQDTDPNVSKSVLSQNLSSSVTNTLNFTLRQTGMPTGCLPAADQSSTDEPTQVNFALMSAKKIQTVGELNTDPKSLKQDLKAESSIAGASNPVEIPPHVEKLNDPLCVTPSSLNSSSEGSEKRAFNFDISISKPEGGSTAVGDSSVVSEFPDGSKKLGEKSPKKDNDTSLESNTVQSRPATSNSGASAGNNVSSSTVDCASGKSDLNNPHLLSSTIIKKEKLSYDEDLRGVVASLHAARNVLEGSSDEEVENYSKELAAMENEQGSQNVLLKQLLQNCPSAESSVKLDGEDIKQEDSSKTDAEDASCDVNRDSMDKRNEDFRLKKQSYLDIRRAQLEKEPTPPPGEAKFKQMKRKRPKKKRIDSKEGSPVRKKCRKGSKSEETYGTSFENLMTQLTNLPPLRILEPNIQPNYNTLSVFGAGDLNSKGNQLKGTYGNANVPNQSDVYSYYPFGDEPAPPMVALPPSPPYRGFYNEEFASPLKGKQEMSALKTIDSQRTFRDIESPDTIISSSSPESCMFESLCKWPELFGDQNETGPEGKKSYSPVFPLIAPIPIRLTPHHASDTGNSNDFDQDKDKENIPKADFGVLKSKVSNLGSYTTPLKDSGNVSVTLTVSSSAAEDICGILSKLADLLKISVPTTYDIVERTATPPSQKLGLYRKSKNSEMNIHALLNGKPCFCRHCDIVVLSAGIRKKACDLTCISKEEQEEDDEVIFCSTNCYMQFALTHRSSASTLKDKEAAAIVNHPSENISESDFPMKSILSDEETQSAVVPKIGCSSNTVTDSNIEIDEKTGDAVNIQHRAHSQIKIEPIDISYETGKNDTTANVKQENTLAKKWKSVKYKYWTPSFAALQMYKSNKEEQIKVTKPFYETIKPPQMPEDKRRCIFCSSVGDSDADGAARLLNVDVDEWVHLNCALWSAEVYETQNGALMNVETSYKRAIMLECCSCHRHGASLKCFKIRCPNIYHFSCAMKEHSIFFKDKTLLCPNHANKYSENELESLSVPRRVYIDRDEHKQVASMIQGDQYVMRIGSLIFLNIGQLLPQQMQAFHTPNCIYPVGYKIIRIYWSMRTLGKRCQYVCSINEVNGKPEFHIQVKENDHKDIVLKDKTSKGLWQKVIYPIEKMRRHAKTIKIFPDFITGDDLFGLTEPAVLRIVESLPGVDTLMDYNFRYGRSPFLELPLAINPTGCARSEPKLRTHVKRSHTLHTSNSTRTSFHSTFSGMEISSPYIKQFVHSKSSQYRKMKTEWRNNVYLARSKIQGLGLYASRDLEKHTMVIEYIGQLIRNEIAERNEQIYDDQNRGIYMFRLDENRVIDATLSGGLARYMNHSCNPNCVAEVVQIDRENKILIIANRRISRGEELSYDYKFEVEDDQHKIACLCKAPNCRKWMN